MDKKEYLKNQVINAREMTEEKCDEYVNDPKDISRLAEYHFALGVELALQGLYYDLYSEYAMREVKE